MKAKKQRKKIDKMGCSVMALKGLHQPDKEYFVGQGNKYPRIYLKKIQHTEHTTKPDLKTHSWLLFD